MRLEVGVGGGVVNIADMGGGAPNTAWGGGGRPKVGGVGEGVLATAGSSLSVPASSWRAMSANDWLLLCPLDPDLCLCLSEPTLRSLSLLS